MNHWALHPMAQAMEDFYEFTREVERAEREISKYGFATFTYQDGEDFFVEVSNGASYKDMTDAEFFKWYASEEWIND